MKFEDVQEKVLAFRDDRDWSQFHNPKDLAISISLEAAELLECFQWSGKDLEGRANRNHMSEELADVLVYCIYLADTLGVSIADIVSAKIDLDAIKYPVDKYRDSGILIRAGASSSRYQAVRW